jgi:hypothetical protein
LVNSFLGAAPRAFESRPEPTRQFWKPARANSLMLKGSQSQLTDFESRQELTLPVFKSFSQIQKFFKLNGKEFINSI